MNNSGSGSRSRLERFITDALGLAPHLLPLLESLVSIRFDPRTPALVALAVARTRATPAATFLCKIIASVAGLTEQERRGEIEDLTRAELAAIGLAIGTTRCPREQLEDETFPDQHFTPEQIRQLRAVALAIDCYLGRPIVRR